MVFITIAVLQERFSGIFIISFHGAQNGAFQDALINLALVNNIRNVAIMKICVQMYVINLRWPWAIESAGQRLG